MRRIGLRVSDLKYWNTFLVKYEKFRQHYPNIEGYFEKELEAWKRASDHLFNNGTIVDGVSWINN
jgi:hypothetical protein